MKGLIDSKNVKEINFVGVWGELESKEIFQYLRLQFSCQIVHNVKSLISVFQEFSTSINKTFILAGRLGTRLSFYEV